MEPCIFGNYIGLVGIHYLFRRIDLSEEDDPYEPLEIGGIWKEIKVYEAVESAGDPEIVAAGRRRRKTFRRKRRQHKRTRKYRRV